MDFTFGCNGSREASGALAWHSPCTRVDYNNGKHVTTESNSYLFNRLSNILLYSSQRDSTTTL